MGKPRVIHTDGEDLVVMKRSDYEALRAVMTSSLASSPAHH